MAAMTGMQPARAATWHDEIRAIAFDVQGTCVDFYQRSCVRVKPSTPPRGSRSTGPNSRANGAISTVPRSTT